MENEGEVYSRRRGGVSSAAGRILSRGTWSSAAQLKAMAEQIRHAAMQTASVMSLLLFSMCPLQFFFPLQKDHFVSRVHSSQITVAMTSKPQPPQALEIPVFGFGFAFYSRY